MTPLTSSSARLTLDPATTDATLATIFGALRLDPDRTPGQLQIQRDAGAALIAALHPRDPVEATYAARAAAAHYASMECFRRAILPDTPDNAAIRWHGKAIALSRMNKDMIRALRESQAETHHAEPPPVQPAVAQPTVEVAERLSLALAAEVARRAAAARAKPGGTQDPMSSERMSFTPASSALMTEPAAMAFRSAPPHRQSQRATLLSSTPDAGAMLGAATAEARPNVQ